jgi:hypothetical protein
MANNINLHHQLFYTRSRASNRSTEEIKKDMQEKKKITEEIAKKTEEEKKKKNQ